MNVILSPVDKGPSVTVEGATTSDSSKPETSSVNVNVAVAVSPLVNSVSSIAMEVRSGRCVSMDTVVSMVPVPAVPSLTLVTPLRSNERVASVISTPISGLKKTEMPVPSANVLMLIPISVTGKGMVTSSLSTPSTNRSN